MQCLIRFRQCLYIGQVSYPSIKLFTKRIFSILTKNKRTMNFMQTIKYTKLDSPVKYKVCGIQKFIWVVLVFANSMYVSSFIDIEKSFFNQNKAVKDRRCVVLLPMSLLYNLCLNLVYMVC